MTVYHKEVLFSMLQREFTFPSSDGKTDLHAVDWVPDSPVRAVLQISHGVSEYILRYQALASFLTERGIAVAGHDHLGHGTSVERGRTSCPAHWQAGCPLPPITGALPPTVRILTGSPATRKTWTAI